MGWELKNPSLAFFPQTLKSFQHFSWVWTLASESFDRTFTLLNIDGVVIPRSHAWDASRIILRPCIHGPCHKNLKSMSEIHGCTGVCPRAEAKGKQLCLHCLVLAEIWLAAYLLSSSETLQRQSTVELWPHPRTIFSFFSGYCRGGTFVEVFPKRMLCLPCSSFTST